MQVRQWSGVKSEIQSQLWHDEGEGWDQHPDVQHELRPCKKVLADYTLLHANAAAACFLLCLDHTLITTLHYTIQLHITNKAEHGLKPCAQAARNQTNDGMLWLSTEEFFDKFQYLYLCERDMGAFCSGSEGE